MGVSQGKTTLARVAASVSPEGPAAVKNWNRTARSFGPLFLHHNDGFLILDDLALVSPGKSQQRDVLHACAYELTATETRQYSPLLDRAAPQGTYRLLGLSTGEKSAAEIAALGGDPRLAGEEARFIDLPARKSKTGVFDRLKAAGHHRTAKHSAMLAGAMSEASETYYGTAGPAFLERIVEDQEHVRERTNRYMEEFFAKAGVPAGRWERRFALKFAIVYAAGRLARKFGILPWSERLIFSCVKRAYRRARGAVPTPTSTPLARISFDQLRELLSEDRVVNLLDPNTPGDAKAINKAEVLRLDYKGEVCFAITQKALQALGRKPVVERLLRQLDAAGLLVQPSDHPKYRTCQIKPQKGAKRRRFYVVLESVKCVDPTSHSYGTDTRSFAD